MPTVKRTLLVVEDDEPLSLMLTMLCQEALQELSQEGAAIEGVVKQAHSFGKAMEYLEQADFMSIDLALNQSEVGLTDQERKTREAGGISLLNRLNKSEKEPLVVVVSGELAQSYALDVYGEHEVLNFFKKGAFDNEEYKHAVKAALWYLDAVDLVDNFEKKLAIEAAAKSWEKALAAAKTAGIKEGKFPENLGVKIQYVKRGLTHPVTKLPISRWTEEMLKNRVVGRKDNWALIQVTLEGFNAFVKRYASQEEPILSYISRLFKGLCEDFDDKAMFVGHLGHNTSRSEPSFVVIPGDATIHLRADIGQWLKREFAKVGSRPFAKDPRLMDYGNERSQEVLTFTVAVNVLPDAANNYFAGIDLLLDTLAQAQIGP